MLTFKANDILLLVTTWSIWWNLSETVAILHAKCSCKSGAWSLRFIYEYLSQSWLIFFPTSSLIPSLTVLSGYSLRLHCFTQTHTHPRQPELKKAQALSCVYSGLISARFVQFWLPDILAIFLFAINLFLCLFPGVLSPFPNFILLSSSCLAVQACSHSPFSSICNIQIHNKDLPFVQPSSSDFATQNLLWFANCNFVFTCHIKQICILDTHVCWRVHPQLIYLLLLTQQWVLNLSYLVQNQRVCWNFLIILFILFIFLLLCTIEVLLPKSKGPEIKIDLSCLWYGSSKEWAQSTPEEVWCEQF